MTKKKKKESPLWNIIPVTGLIALIGITMAIFEIPYGHKIAMAGGLWLGASFVIGVIYIAMKDDQKKKEREKRRGVKKNVRIRRKGTTKEAEVQAR